MFKYRVLCVVFVVVALLSACNPNGTLFGSGKVVTQEVAASNFDRVEVGGAFRVDIRQAESYSVAIRIDDNLVQCLDVYASGGTLHIGLKSECWVSGATTMEAQVTMPTLTGMNLSGASHGTITGFKSSKDLTVEVSGASSLQGDIEAGNMRLNVSGASQLTLTGTGGNLTAEASGASHIDLEGLPIKDASVELSGASSATVYPSGRIDVGASGASHLYYLGSPTLGRVETSGASSIEGK
jgi:hypothetical protein